MKALLLAAGRGSRLGERTADRPKCLVEVAGRPLLAWQLDALHAARVQAVTIVTGWCAGPLERYGTRRIHNPAWETTNMVCSLLAARDELGHEPVIVAYTDLLYTAETIGRLMAAPDELVIAYDPLWRRLWERRFANPLDDAESFRMTPAGEVVDIGRRVTSYAEIGGQYMGLLRIGPLAWQAIAALLDSQPRSVLERMDMTLLLRRLIDARAVAVHGVAAVGPWCEIDSASDLLVAEEILQGYPNFPLAEPPGSGGNS